MKHYMSLLHQPRVPAKLGRLRAGGRTSPMPIYGPWAMHIRTLLKPNLRLTLRHAGR